MEFGTKLKTVREQKGITQQTLADHLYVTRQAVSRWECGARYPDLMTAKKISEYFDISMDELITGDDWRSYPEKQPVIESGKAGRLQTAVYAVSAVLMLMSVVVRPFVFSAATGQELSEILSSVFKDAKSSSIMLISALASMVTLLISAGLIYGTYRSVQKTADPKVSGAIMFSAFVYQGLEHLMAFVSALNIGFVPGPLVMLGISLFGIAATADFFFVRKHANPVLFYIAAGISFALESATVFRCLHALVDTTVNRDASIYLVYYHSAFSSAAFAMLFCLGIVQAKLIMRKRKLSLRQVAAKVSKTAV
jgi:transcriptional regulator with XRE-family HTH domain